jgi:ankyrin repeat protein
MTDANLICEAAATGDVEAVRVLLEKDPALVHAHSRDGWTPLHLAAHGGHKRVVEALLAGGADVQAPADNSLASTPLLWAISGQDLETVTLLLAHGADVNSASNAGSTPLHKAAVLGNVAIVQLLLAHDAQVNARNSGGQTPLTHALYNRHEDVAMLLRLSKGSE